MELLAALIFGLIIFGFTALMLVPLIFAVLMIGVFREPLPATAGAPEPPAGELEPPPEVDLERERPRTRAAGRRDPIS